MGSALRRALNNVDVTADGGSATANSYVGEFVGERLFDTRLVHEGIHAFVDCLP